MKTDYELFLESKQRNHIESGFDVDESQLNQLMFPFQKFITKRALRNGKYAIFADCGLGKTLMQLEWAYQVWKFTGKPVLILAPLAVAGQTIQEGKKFNIDICRYNGGNSPIQITNYEQLEKVDCSIFGGIVLDESSILKNFEGSTKKLIIDSFKNTPYKLACTATPSPNDPMELGNHSEFLDYMSRNEMLAMYFVHDGGETAKWRLKGHAVKLFYQFIGTWAIMLNKPGDIGFEMNSYELPALNLIEKQIETQSRNNGQLFNDVAVSATNFNAELRITKVERLSEAAKIINDSDELFIVTVKQNEEADILRKLIPDAIEVRGSDKDTYKEGTLLRFANNEFRVLLSKGKIIKFGLNYQNCHNIVVCSLDFSFEELYQLIRRCLRYGQKHVVNLYLITTDTMTNVKKSIELKQKQFDIMQHEMSIAVNINLNGGSLKTGDFDTIEVKNDHYHIKQGDSFQLIKEIPYESIGLSIFSPAFPELYCYSNNTEDLGNCKDYNEFLRNFSFLPPELFRITKQGRNVAIHCMDTPIQKGKHGFIGLRDFSGMILTEMEKAGFIYHSRICLWKDPVIEMQRTKALGLLHKQVKKDSTMSRVGIPDYILVFRKDGERCDPVTNTDMSVDLWQKYASPVWEDLQLNKYSKEQLIETIGLMRSEIIKIQAGANGSTPGKWLEAVWMDINQGDTLQGFRNGRDDNDEKHIAPLQLQTIERLIHLYSNEGDTIFEPFGGIGSVPFKAVEMKRRAIAFELKNSYFDLMKKNLASCVELKNQVVAEL